MTRSRKRQSRTYFRQDQSSDQQRIFKESIFKLNSKIVYSGLLLIAIGLVIQMARWQILSGERFHALAQSQYIGSQRQESSRGIIFASDGTILATDQPAWNVYASLSSIAEEREDFFAEKDKFITTISGILAVEQETVASLITDDFRYVPIAKNIDGQKMKALREADIFSKREPGFGLYFEKSEKRIYPNGQLASQVIGFMGKSEIGEDKGLYGVEGYYFGDLTGTEGFTYQEQDSTGNVILTSEYDPVLPRKGKDIKITINPGIQTKVEEALKEGVEKQQAKSGTAIIMDPRTGAIIAMANYPSYNPNEYWRTQESWIFKNKAVADVYEPGSIFKPLTVAIGLETGAINKGTKCNDTTGFIKIFEGTPDEKTIYTWDRKPDGELTPEGYLQYSNNPCIVQTALKIGHQQYYPKMQEFGIGNFIGMGLQDETNSYLMPYEYWTKLDLAVTSFGQSVSVTPMQILSALSAIANDGVRMKPYIVEQVIDDDEIITYTPQELSRPISEQTAHDVADMMRSVVTKGDASKYFIKYLPDYDVSGKTGTAQIPRKDQAGYYKDRTNATFVGFAPSNGPKMIMLVRLEEPKISEFAATTAVPVWIDVFRRVADDLEIPRK